VGIASFEEPKRDTGAWRGGGKRTGLKRRKSAKKKNGDKKILFLKEQSQSEGQKTVPEPSSGRYQPSWKIYKQRDFRESGSRRRTTRFRRGGS